MYELSLSDDLNITIPVPTNSLAKIIDKYLGLYL
jgi:hypothetical protein